VSQAQPKHHTANPPAAEAEYVGRLQAAALLGVNVQTIDAWIRSAKLRAYKPARRVLIKRAELVSLVEHAQV